MRDRNDARTHRQLPELRQQFGVEPRQQVERDDGRPFAQVEREDVALFNRDQPLYALLGGFHLSGPLFEPLIPRVLDDLAALDPGVLVPAHCTGWRAQHAMSARFPDAYVPNAVGTSLLL